MPGRGATGSRQMLQPPQEAMDSTATPQLAIGFCKLKACYLAVAPLWSDLFVGPVDGSRRARWPEQNGMKAGGRWSSDSKSTVMRIFP